MLHAATFRKSTRPRKTLQVYYGHQRLQPGDYGDTAYMFEALNIQDKSVPHEARVGVAEAERVARLWAQAKRMTKGREERMTMAEFTCIPPRFWRDHPDPEARAFYLGPGLNKRSKQFAVAHGIALEDLPPGGPPLSAGGAPRAADLRSRDPQGELETQLRNAAPKL